MKRSILFLAFLLPFLAMAQNAPACSDLKHGIFYSYPKNSSDYYIELMDDDLLQEIKNGQDTISWKVKWLNSCTYSLKYISGNVGDKKETLELVNKHQIVFTIDKITESYYIYTGYLDNIKNLPLTTDTMWLVPKIAVNDNLLLKQVKNPVELKRAHFSDTSKYAVIYIYRPARTLLWLFNYPVYMDGNIICVARNDYGYIFKILKEGTYHFNSKYFKSESAISVDIKFGKSYYLKTIPRFTMKSFSRNYNLETTLMKPEEGSLEFLDIRNR